MKTLASFSPCRTYRYTLTRHWGDGDRFACFIALNPSIADEQRGDNTATRMINFAKSWQMDGLYVVNLFALVSTDRSVLKTHLAPIGPDNDGHIIRCAQSAEIVVAAWGRDGRLRDRNAEVLQLLKAKRIKLQALEINADGSPKHPLYMRGDCELQPLA